MARGAWLLLVAGALLVAGCASPDGNAHPGSEPSPLPPRIPVVAILDSGVNPYHAAFAATDAWERKASASLAGVDAVPLVLTQRGELAAREAADADVWGAIAPETAYHVVGTRLLVVSFGREPARPPVLDPVGHGTRTASLVARDAPDALIVMVQVDTRVCREASCLVDPSVAEGMGWVARQPWIDVVSVSLAVPGNAPDTPALHAEAGAYIAATRAAHDAGKLIVNGAGNEPSPSLVDYFNGPSWIVCVGGAQPRARGESLHASRAVDVMANHTETVADAKTVDGYMVDTGTSLATPIVAATLAQALYLLQPQPGAAARESLRDALNASAEPFSVAEWRPAPPSSATLPELFSQSAPVLLAGPQGGWGFIHAGLAPELARRAASGEETPRASPLTSQWQEEWQGTRDEFWSRWT